MQHLQEQLQAQYSRQQQQQSQQGQPNQQQLMFSGMASALNAPMVGDPQQSQLNSNQNQHQWGMSSQQQGLGDQSNSLGNTALALMQQQQQQQMSGMTSNNSSGLFNWGGMQAPQGMSQGAAASMDASSASSAQLAAIVGMGMGGGSLGGSGGGSMGNSSGKGGGMMENSNIQAFLQQQQQGGMNSVGGGGLSRDISSGVSQQSGHSMQSMNQQQQQQQLNNSNHGGQLGNTSASGGNANAQMLLQQQLAKLQRQFQGQQEQLQQQGMPNSNLGRNSENANTLMQTQQQLMQQMRQQRGSTSSLQQLQQQQLGNTGNTNGFQQQRGGTSGHHQSSQRGSTAALQQMGQQGSALSRLQQMTSSSSQQSGAGGIHRMPSGANLNSGQMQRTPSQASVHRTPSSLGLQGGQQGGSNQNWMAPLPSVGGLGVQQQQNQQTNRALAAMQNAQNQQNFQNQSNSGMGTQQQLLSNAMNSSGDAFGNSGLSQQDLLLQQSQLLRSNSLSQNMMPDSQQDSLLMNQNSNSGNMNQGMQMNSMSSQSQMGFPNLQSGTNESSGLQGSQGHQGTGMHAAPMSSSDNNVDSSSGSQKSFLDGNFAGGWQSNADLPDRRHIIYSILDVIKQMRPDTNKISQKLPHMAKSLEEHLYRSAQTKEEYLDLSTLKKRLQMIAQGLELHRTSAGSNNSSQKDNLSQVHNAQSQQQQQQQLLQQMSGQNMGNAAAQQQLQRMTSSQHGMSNNSSSQNMGGNNQNQNMGLNASMFGGSDAVSGNTGNTGMQNSDSSKYQDPIAAQKKRVIKQQQQRLLLLRHASKCTLGPACKTKFCAQMVTLWKHMKRCRDKNCSTSHCLSSRCVLNHYRICKSQMRTATCEVCGPVMEQIKRQEAGEDLSDPLTKDQEISSPALEAQMSVQGNGNNSQQGTQDQQQLQQLQQLQVAQMKLQNQLQLLKQLQRQQEQLLQQQRHIQEQQSHIKDPHTQQGQLLQQQQALLQQLQQRCQQQQVLLQQELTLQSNAINNAQQSSGIQLPLNVDKSLSSVKDTDAQPKRNSIVRRNSKGGKSVRGRGGKGKTLRPEGDLFGGDRLKLSTDAPKNEADEEVGDDGGGGNGNGSKKRNNPDEKTEVVSSISVMEPARKMIKLEPQKPSDETDSVGLDQPVVTDNIASSLQEGGNSSEQEPKDKTGENISQFAGMSKESIEQRLNSLETPSDMTSEAVTEKCLPLMNYLLEDPFGWVFRDAVDPEALGLPDYFEVVKKPMHFELVKENLVSNKYSDMDAFQRDVCLVFENSILYNGETSEVGQLALNMMSAFAEKYEGLVKSMVTA